MNLDFPTGDEPPKRRFLNTKLQRNLVFFLRLMQRRFPDRTEEEIIHALEQALEEMAPSKMRTQLQRRMIALLSRMEEKAESEEH
jgi:hypothetical protein